MASCLCGRSRQVCESGVVCLGKEMVVVSMGEWWVT